ncbi:MAG: amino acid carrier protein [Gillisia sp.]|nr:amino acid carrier protein [Gillisia sp.]
MRKYLLSALFTFSLFSIYAQDLNIKANVGNPSNLINDGFIDLEVEGGTPPYTYKWDNQSTLLTSARSEGLAEGVPYSVVVTDSKGVSSKKTYTVEAESITEHFNGAFKPLVAQMEKVLFWDPFTAIGIYDPVVYADIKNVPTPGWEAGVQDRFILKKWLKPENSRVKEGDLIAIVESDEGEDLNVYANAPGTLRYLADKEEVIYNYKNKEDVIMRGAHNVAQIVYDDPVALIHPNGDLIKKNIPFIVVWLLFGALFFTIRMGFINIRGFKHSLQLASGKFDDPDAPGQITHFQALSTAISGTVGLGNIAGVAVAISLGGAGATFWMILAGLVGMSSKFVECTLGVKYRFINSEGRVFGGPMNYLRYGLEKRNQKGLGKVLAALFSVLAIGASFGGGNMFQSNQAFEQLQGQFPFMVGNGFYFGVVIALLVGVVIIGGINSIAKVTEKIVPIMAAVYILGCFIVIFINIENILPALNAIYVGAFNPTALKGGIIGVLIVGFQRAAFSNEAGVGSAAIAHSASKTSHPPSEGFVALLGPFIDTVVVCTLTALVLVFTGMHEAEGIAGAQLTSDAFGSVVSWFPYVLTLAVLLFAFSTMISWSYYGMRAWTYLFGKSRRSEIIYKVMFLIFVVIGASVSLGAVLDFSDMMILAMSFPNIIGLYIMSGEVKTDLNAYLKKLKAGELYMKGAEVKAK